MGYKTDDDIPEQLGPGYKLGYLQCRQNFQSFMIFLFTNFFFQLPYLLVYKSNSCISRPPIFKVKNRIFRNFWLKK